MWEMLFERSQSKKKRKGIKMNSKEVDKWSEKHVGSLALTRTIVGFINVIIGLIVVFKLFGVI